MTSDLIDRWNLPDKEPDPWVIRADFTNDDAWQALCALIAAPQRDGDDEFFAYVRYVSDPRYADRSPQQIVATLPDAYGFKFCFVADRECLQRREFPLLLVGFYPYPEVALDDASADEFDDEEIDPAAFLRFPREVPASDLRMFRAVPSAIQAIQNNLSIGNMDFEEFANAVDADGVYRGVRRGS